MPKGTGSQVHIGEIHNITHKLNANRADWQRPKHQLTADTPVNCPMDGNPDTGFVPSTMKLQF